MTLARCLCAGWACAALCLPAEASRIGVSDETDVAEAGECEAEGAHERSRLRGEPARREQSLRLACGIGWNTELEAAHARQRQGAARGEALAVEAKTMLRERAGDRIGWSLAVAVGAERRNGSWRRSEQGLALEATRQTGDSSLVEVKLGVVHDVLSRRDSTLWSVAVEHALHERFELRAELEGDDHQRSLAKAGLRWTLWPDRLQLKLSHGLRSGPQRERSTSLGLLVEF
jgi:hypothetical protein